MVHHVDFKHLEPINKPNYYLVCPREYCNLKPQQYSPVMGIDVNALMSRGEQVLDGMSRTQKIAYDAKRKQFQYVQKSLIFRFPDIVTIQYIPIDKQHSTMAILSRSKYGYSDFGVNKKRVQYILKSLTQSN